MYYYVQYDKNNFPLIIGMSSFKQDIEISKEEYDILIQENEQIQNYIYALQNQEIHFSDIPIEYQEKIQYKLSLIVESQVDTEEVNISNE